MFLWWSWRCGRISANARLQHSVLRPWRSTRWRRRSRRKKAKISTTSSLHVSKITSQIVQGASTQVTPRSAAAKERMNKLAVVCNLLLLAMMKITQLFPTKLKKMKNRITTRIKSILYWLSHWIFSDNVNLLSTWSVEESRYQLVERVFRCESEETSLIKLCTRLPKELKDIS